MSVRCFTASSGPLMGAVRVPGDKSLSHRAVLFASMAEGESRLTGVLDSADVNSTIAACRALGARIEPLPAHEGSSDVLRVIGWGARGPVQPEGVIDCGNSGTTVRLLMGLLAGWPITVTLTGDESLSRRPMLRVTEPLSRMGARFEVGPKGTLPVTVNGADRLTAISYDSPVASAQVKTAILLAGLRAEGTTRVTEPALSRDHTERLLPVFGVAVSVDPTPAASVRGPAVPTASDVAVPADPSSAAFLIVAALIVVGSDVTLTDVSLNPTRIGFLEVLERMGGDIDVDVASATDSEPYGTIRVRHSPDLRGTTVRALEIPALIDEVPILAVAATRAAGTTRFDGVEELRVKESDRLQAVAEGLSAMEATVRSGHDWLEVDGASELRGARLSSLHDHRLAMAWAVASLVATGETCVSDWDAVNVSYPGFGADLERLTSS